jgi:hypothetical protein
MDAGRWAGKPTSVRWVPLCRKPQRSGRTALLSSIEPDSDQANPRLWKTRRALLPIVLPASRSEGLS